MERLCGFASHVPQSKFLSLRSELLKKGIDIAIRQPFKPNNIIPLVRVLRPEVISQIPNGLLVQHFTLIQKNRLSY